MGQPCKEKGRQLKSFYYICVMESKNNQPYIIKTDDGSQTIVHPTFHEQYHSVKGARSESMHIFVQLALREWMKGHPAQKVRVLELGFGTGLNALLTCVEANEVHTHVEYSTLELYPLGIEEARSLEYMPKEVFEKVLAAEWGQQVGLSEWFTLCKRQEDFLLAPLNSGHFDVVYFDAFSPETQPELWGEELLQKIYVAMASGGVLTTYCAKGVVRRMLQQVGFVVERMPGPPNGKREVLRAWKT